MTSVCTISDDNLVIIFDNLDNLVWIMSVRFSQSKVVTLPLYLISILWEDTLRPYSYPISHHSFITSVTFYWQYLPAIFIIVVFAKWWFSTSIISYLFISLWFSRTLFYSMSYNSLLSLFFNWIKISQLKTLPFDSYIFLTYSHNLLCYSLFSIPRLSYTFLALAWESAISPRKPDNFYWRYF